MKLIFALIFVLSLTGCLNSEPEFKKGDCLNPVDGSEIWLLDASSPKMKGFRLIEKKWSQQPEVLPDRIYGKIPCPI